MALNFAAALTARSVLQDFSNRANRHVKKWIDKGVAGGLLLEVEGGRQANLAIENAKNAYLSSLDITIDKIDAAFKQNLLLINAMVTELETKTASDLFELTGRLQVLADSLPDATLQVRDFAPRVFCIENHAEEIPFTIHGRFPNIDQTTFSLAIEELVIPATVTMTSHLQFLIPSKLFSKKDPLHTSLCPMVLHMKERTSFVSRLLWSPVEGSVKLTLPIVKPSPGTISLQLVRRTLTQQVAESASAEYSQEAPIGPFKRTGNQVFEARPSPGWSIKPETSRIEVLRQNGSHSCKLLEEASHVVRYRVCSYPDKANPKAVICFRIRFQQYRDEITETSSEEPLSLNWGESVSRDVTGASWRLALNGSDGSHQEFTQSNISHSYLSITQTGQNLQIQIKPINVFYQAMQESRPLQAKL